jgi:predicted ATPase
MSPGFSSLSVAGYRRLTALNGIGLGQFNVLIGANGVGKSSILDVFGLLAASAKGTLQTTINDLGGMASLLTADGRTNAITLGLQMDQEGEAPLNYQIRLSGQAIGYVIAHELLTQDAPAPVPVKYIDAAGPRVRYHGAGGAVEEPVLEHYKSQETFLSQMQQASRKGEKPHQKAENFQRVLDDISEVYHSLDVSARAPVRTPQTLFNAQTPGADGADLVSCLYTIRETARERFEAIEDALRAAFPAFERLDFPPVAAGRPTLAWKENGFARAFYGSELSEGTLRFLWLATLLQSPGLPRITLIDEPEVSLHPEMLRLLADLMREASERTQLIVATHSDRFVRFLNPNELIVCDLDETGGMTARRADQLDLDLEAWLEEYTLDQLWSKGILGGRS